MQTREARQRTALLKVSDSFEYQPGKENAPLIETTTSQDHFASASFFGLSAMASWDSSS
jgi:hypothetical protein